jgi:hypothetical protein
MPPDRLRLAGLLAGLAMLLALLMTAPARADTVNDWSQNSTYALNRITQIR